jgi:single-stranded-DNA-specific exonuclease
MGDAETFPFAHLRRPWVVAKRLPATELNVAGFTPLQVQLLHNRGIDGGGLARFRNADWRAAGPPLTDSGKAVARIQAALADREHITVYGDYDCDGITSCALLTLSLQLLGAEVSSYIPIREDDGRGLNAEAVKMLAGQGTTLLITTDCGTANIDEVKLAKRLGIDVIVTDHHPLHGTCAEALAVLNPQRPDDASISKDLAGVGVAFRLAEALAGSSGNAALQKRLPSLLDLVAIGTIADVVPLSKENWALAHAGLEMLKVAPGPGLAALAERTGLHLDLMSERDISFGLAPRLNAAGRLGRPRAALDLLLTTEPQEAERLARELDELNGERQRITEEVLSEAKEQVSRGGRGPLLPAVLIVRGNDWPLGILGLVAGRLADEYQRPTFVISSNGEESRGSARGPRGVDLGKTLAGWPGAFRRFGGHAQAAGFTIANLDLDRFTSDMEQVFAGTAIAGLPETVSGERGRGEGEGSPLVVDCLMPLGSVAEDRYWALRALAPFGVGFPEPVFISTGLKIWRSWRSGPEGRNLRLMLGDATSKVSFLWSRQGALFDSVQARLPRLSPVDVIYTMDGFRRRDGTFEVMPRILTMELSTR